MNMRCGVFPKMCKYVKMFNFSIGFPWLWKFRKISGILKSQFMESFGKFMKFDDVVQCFPYVFFCLLLN